MKQQGYMGQEMEYFSEKQLKMFKLKTSQL